MNLYTLSRGALSATQPSLRNRLIGIRSCPLPISFRKSPVLLHPRLRLAALLPVRIRCFFQPTRTWKCSFSELRKNRVFNSDHPWSSGLRPAFSGIQFSYPAELCFAIQAKGRTPLADLKNGGRGGIRTHGRFPYAGFQDRYIRPALSPFRIA